MPAARYFIDSATFLYTMDHTETARGALAENWLKILAVRNAGYTNLQVLNEVASVLTRKSDRFPASDPFFKIDAFAQFGSSVLSQEIVLLARDIFRRYRYSWWDTLLLASALELGCSHFLSEDMQDGQIVSDGTRSLTIINPFTHSPDQILTQ